MTNFLEKLLQSRNYVQEEELFAYLHSVVLEAESRGDGFWEYIFKAAICFSRMEYKEALLLINEAISAGNDSSAGHYLKAACLYQLDQYEEALSIIEAHFKYEDVSTEVSLNVLLASSHPETPFF